MQSVNEAANLALAAASIVFAVLMIWLVATLRRNAAYVTVFEHQAGLRYQNGKLAAVLGPGRYSTFWPGTVIQVEDMREQLTVIAAQEMLTADTLPLKISIAVRHRTSDARLKAVAAQNPLQLLYNDIQIALRQVVSARPLEVLLADRGAIAHDLKATAAAQALARGMEVISVEVRDVMLSGEGKRAYADIFRAKKDGEAALERARGETASLRHLANAARLLQGNPALFNLRLLQTLTTAGAKGATVVLNTSGAPVLDLSAAAKPEAPEAGEG